MLNSPMTVRDFKDHLLKRIGAQDHLTFTMMNQQCCDFWDDLNKITTERFPKERYADVPDIDAEVLLTSTEWTMLDKRLSELIY